MRQTISSTKAAALAAPAAFALALVALTSPAGAQSAINPGYWETTSRVISPFPQKKVEQRCIKPSDVAKFMQGPSNRMYTCTYPTRQIGDGKILLKGSCRTKNSGPVPISGEGEFTAETLRIDVNIVATLGGLKIPVHARSVGRRLGDTCPVEPAPPTGEAK
jgi:hypothetical protein